MTTATIKTYKVTYDAEGGGKEAADMLSLTRGRDLITISGPGAPYTESDGYKSTWWSIDGSGSAASSYALRDVVDFARKGVNGFAVAQP